MSKHGSSLRFVLIFTAFAILFAVFVPATALMMSSGTAELASIKAQSDLDGKRDIAADIVQSESRDVEGKNQDKVQPDVVLMVGPVSQDKDLKNLPYIAPKPKEAEDRRMMRTPPSV